MVRTLLNSAAWMASTACLCLSSGCHGPQSAPAPLNSALSPSYNQSIPESGLQIQLTLVPGDGTVDSFYMADREIDWDIFDAFIFDLDEMPVKGTPEAETRPTRPYMLVDRGFGHAGYPAISMSQRGAEAFCLWISEMTGHTYRLPTVAEWSLACQQGAITGDVLPEHAWFEGNAEGTTHPVATKRPDVNGLHDLHGNVAEWAIDEQGNGVIMGGSFVSSIDDITCTNLQPSTRDWNESDPQIPKSIWWLADGAFIGFRVVRTPHS